MTSRHGVHAKNQTAFRLPEGLLARLKDGAQRHGQTMTDIAAHGIAAELDRLDGITTSAAPAKPVSPPRRPRKPKADTAPVATFKPPEPPEPQQTPRRTHALTCKCMMCKPTGGK